MRRLFKVGSNRHDTGKVTIAWQHDGNFLASAGKNGVGNDDDYKCYYYYKLSYYIIIIIIISSNN